MRLITTLATASLLITASATGIQQSPPDRPNVVLIMTDDAGYADTGSYGARDIRTPNIDSLARDGVKLTDFYANAMSCTPTRAGLITRRSIEFINANATRPFFIDVAFNAPHSPVQRPDVPAGKPAPGGATRADYAAVMERVDRGVGEILQTLRARGLERNTIVIDDEGRAPL